MTSLLQQDFRSIATQIVFSGRLSCSKVIASFASITMSFSLTHIHRLPFCRKIWDCLVVVGLMWYLFSVPLSLMYIVENSPLSKSPVLMVLGYMVDLFFVMDAILQFHYFMYSHEGLVVFDKNHIHEHFYQKRNWIREVVGLVPFDLIACFFGGRFCHYFRLFKLLRVPNLAMYTEAVDVIFAEMKIDIDLSFYRVIKLNIIMILVCHWVGCCWYMMASLSIHFGLEYNWRYADENDELLTISHSDFGGVSSYLRSVYWAIVGMSTVGTKFIVLMFTLAYPSFSNRTLTSAILPTLPQDTATLCQLTFGKQHSPLSSFCSVDCSCQQWLEASLLTFLNST